MKEQSIKTLFRRYKGNKHELKELQDKVEFYRTQAEKITPTYGNSGGGGGFNTTSKIEINVIKYEEYLDKIQKLERDIKKADTLLSMLKTYQRRIVRDCMINHNSYFKVAERENTSSGNIKKICDNAIRSLAD